MLLFVPFVVPEKLLDSVVQDAIVLGPRMMMRRPCSVEVEVEGPIGGALKVNGKTSGGGSLRAVLICGGADCRGAVHADCRGAVRNDCRGAVRTDCRGHALSLDNVVAVELRLRDGGGHSFLDGGGRSFRGGAQKHGARWAGVRAVCLGAICCAARLGAVRAARRGAVPAAHGGAARGRATGSWTS